MARSRLIILLSVALAALALLASGCGGNANTPGVATVSSHPQTATTTSTTQGGPGPSDQASSGPGVRPSVQFQLAMNVGTTNGGKFSACMRKNGVPNFPDPNSNGVITIQSGTGIDPGSPAFRSARTVCDKLLPNGGKPTPAQIAQRQQQMLAFSVCMRANGIKDFPDPTNGGLQLQGGPGSDLNPSDPAFQKAQQACQSKLPGKPTGGAPLTAGTGK